MIRIFFIVLFISATVLDAQTYLSNLNADKDDPVYTTYAAPMSRTDYTIDQAYHLMWYDPDDGVNFTSKYGGDICIGFSMEDDFRYNLERYYREPVITASYSDIVKMNYYPFEDIRVDAVYNTWSSRTAVIEVTITNEENFSKEITVIPYFRLSEPEMSDIKADSDVNGYVFSHTRKRDGWMLNHNIPLVEERKSLFTVNFEPDYTGVYDVFKNKGRDQSGTFYEAVISGSLNNLKEVSSADVLALAKTVKLKAGESFTFRYVRAVDAAENESGLKAFAETAFGADFKEVIKSNEDKYSDIPEIEFKDEDHEMLYWNAFTLIEQCMMPPEGESKYNWYVFSREPKWGWGYGGQVFHESLVMFAYAFMNPEGAMNSQRIYMERQRDDGYINYRTGAYLNEVIEHNGQFTSSAPWYNYQNYEIFKITGDRTFLEEAYNSGVRFFNYYTSNRDSDNDGLYEWGAHAVLECVRDARVAVWDKVDWPSNFEGVDANAMLYNEAVALSDMADELGLAEDAEKWNAMAEELGEKIRNTFWDDETGFYYHVDKDDHDFTYKEENDLKIKEIIGFLPIWAEVASEKQTEDLMKHLLDEDEFWRRFGIPTLSADHPYYDPLGYWNGPIWVQWQYLLFRGLLDYGYTDTAVELAYRVMDNVINQLKKDHYFWEFYSADDYQAGWNKTYIWTGIVARFLIDINNLNR